MELDTVWITLQEAHDRLFLLEEGRDGWEDEWSWTSDENISPTTAAKINLLFSQALAASKLEAHGVRLDEEGTERGPIVPIPSIYFRQTRTFWPQQNRIEPWSDKSDMKLFVENMQGGPRHPKWVDVVFCRSSFMNWLRLLYPRKFPDEAEFQRFSEATLWGLLPVLVWISTRDLRQAFRASAAGRTAHAADIALSVYVASHPEQDCLCDSISDAWRLQLAPKLKPGILASTATAIRKRATSGFERTFPGVIFPPEDSPGAAQECMVMDRDRKPAVLFEGSQFSHEWTEWHQLRFERSDVQALWPPRNIHDATSRNEQMKGTPKRELRRVSEASARDWFKQRLEHWPPRSNPPTEEQDRVDAKKDMPGIGRQMVRNLRNEIYPRDWLKPGPRKADS